MHKQTVRLFLYSSLAIVALSLVWGFRQIPRQGSLAEDQLRAGLEQELIILSSAVKSSTSALKYRLLDVLKAEGNDRPTRAFQNSPFVAATLLEWDSSAWKFLWHSSKLKDEFQADVVKNHMKEWPLARLAGDEAFFARMGDAGGQAYFAMVVPVRRPGNTPMLGVGIFPANRFGLTFSAERSRDVRVFDNQGFALALPHPAYLGASLKREPLVAEILDGDALTLRQEWKSDDGVPLLGLAQRMSDSNLFAAIETKLPLGRAWYVQAWLYLLLSAAGAVMINWFLFAGLVKPLFTQLAQTEELNEKLRRQLTEQPRAATVPSAELAEAQGEPAIPSAQLPHVGFIDPGAAEPTDGMAAVEAPAVKVSLARIVAAALKPLEPKLLEYGVSVNKIGLEEAEVEGDVLQLQTALEEVLKNAVEAMQETPDRQLTVTAHVFGERVHLSVEDSGCGIGADSLKKIFDPFFSTKNAAPGGEGAARGLGLNVVRRVMEELRGNVQVRDRGGEPGVIVEIEWPRHKGVAVEETAAAPAVSMAGDMPAVPPPPGGAPEADIAALDFLQDEADEVDEFSAGPVPPPREWPEVAIRKPVVRSLD
jgi:anti-sigma regulatory factor (Ser/Thr protein kinase)